MQRHTRSNLDDGHAAPTTAYAGAEGKYEDYMYLDLLEREWRRPVPIANERGAIGPARHPSPRAAIVVQFWSYFETRIERLLRAGMRNLPPRVTEDLMARYSVIRLAARSALPHPVRCNLSR